ncbi:MULTISPECIES: RDD family protein [Citricoccus]|uniref:RDD family protein n=1 Tax=Citricoccus TaxID=169133 RepID=UPI000255F141|nr:RDD family protein [Citricoccus sp. CH26A]
MTTTVVTGEAVVLQIRPASFVVRAGGALLDGLVIAGAFALSAWALAATVVEELDPAAAQAAVLTLVVACLVGLPLVWETLSRGRSPGKLAFGLRVVRDDGGAIRLRHVLVRVLLGVFELWMTLGSVAVLASLFNERGKRLADMVAGTRVVTERRPRVPAPLPGVPGTMTGWAAVADVGRIPDALAASVAQFLRAADRVPPVTRNATATRLAARVAPFVAPGPPAGASVEEFLLAVMAERRNRDYAQLTRQQRATEAAAGRMRSLPYA